MERSKETEEEKLKAAFLKRTFEDTPKIKVLAEPYDLRPKVVDTEQ